MTRLFSHKVGSFGVVVVGLMMSACAARSASNVNVNPPRPPMPPLERVLLDETFERYNPYWRQVRGHWAVAGGRLLQTRDDARDLNTVLFYDPLTIADAEITADMAMLSDLPQFLTPEDGELLRTRRQIGGAGIVFRYQDENNFYLFRLAGEDGVVLGKIVDGMWHELVNPRAVDFAGLRLRSEASYPLRVRVVGHRIQAWIGDRAVANLDDNTFETGRVGLTTFRSKAAFTGLRVVER